jgi:hypothetical protein
VSNLEQPKWPGEPSPRDQPNKHLPKICLFKKRQTCNSLSEDRQTRDFYYKPVSLLLLISLVRAKSQSGQVTAIATVVECKSCRRLAEPFVRPVQSPHLVFSNDKLKPVCKHAPRSMNRIVT